MNLTNRIQFQNPNFQELTKEHTVVDLHFHTCYSDGLHSILAIAERAEALGIGVAITDHNDIRGAIEIEPYKNILTIPGIEITSREGTHLLLYFYDIQELTRFYDNIVKPHLGKDLMSSLTLDLEEIIKRAANYNNLMVFPHPYSPAYTGVCNLHFSPAHQEALFDMIDGIEVINSENIRKSNLKSALLGFNLNKAIVGGSDGHSIYHLGRVVSYAKCQKNRKAFLDAVKHKQSKVIGKEIDIFRKVKSNSLKLRTSIKNYPNLVEKNIKYSWVVINSHTKALTENVKRGVTHKFRKRKNIVKGLL